MSKSATVTQSPVPKDHPLLIAWEKYRQTEEYANTKKWATHNEHVDGSLWAAFLQGWQDRSSLEADFHSDLKRKLLATQEALRVANQTLAENGFLGVLVDNTNP